ncbi:MAG: hypothetical protein M1547_14015 [Gammaproteobacteria bacterium]|nr:hypothetical protein [Gammaproteobacteria bacterium]
MMCSQTINRSIMTGRGYSMMELVLTILLISIIAVTATTMFPGKAVNLGHFINLNATGYSFANASGSVDHPGGSASITLQGLTLTFPSASYAFDGKGVPYDSTSTALASPATITLTDTASSQTRSVVITQQTGRVTVQ